MFKAAILAFLATSTLANDPHLIDASPDLSENDGPSYLCYGQPIGYIHFD